MAKKAAGTATAERGRLPGEGQSFPEYVDQTLDNAAELLGAPRPDAPIVSLADLLERAALLTEDELAAAGRTNYQLREGGASVSLTLNAEHAEPLRRMLLALNQSNARIGTGALTRNVADKANTIRKLMELIAAEIGERASA